MPIYAFRCDACGGEFERLVSAGTASVACGECGSEPTRRVFSVPASQPRLVKTPSERRRQERRNAQLRQRAKADFKRARQGARDGGGKRG